MSLTFPRFQGLNGSCIAALLSVTACGVPLDSTGHDGERPILLQTPSGTLRGVTNGSIEKFLGIPYAAPPVGARRWQPPAAAEAWTDVRDASELGPVCPQASGTSVIGNEDCLTLNVYRPVNGEPGKTLPIVVWIHGGSFVIGAGSFYDPQRLVETNDIIVVTINYRLGPLGFLALPALSSEADDDVSGDYGLMDQQAAIRWVRDNAGAFGGNPEQLTIAGESAGGASVCAQLTSPLASGLFSRAIIQSASCASASLADAESQGTRLANTLACSDASNAATCLRKLSADRIVNASVNANALYGPIVGGELLPTAPDAVVTAGKQPHVPVLIGGLRDEMLGFSAPQYRAVPAITYPVVLSTWFPQADPTQILALYPLEAYPEPFFALSAIFSDSGAFYGHALGGCVTAALTDNLSDSTTTYAYELDDPNFIWAPGASPFPRGASHASDLPFLFDLSFAMSEPFTAPQKKLADSMVQAWGAFVRGGDPSTPDLAWPRYTTADRSMLHLEPAQTHLTRDFRERHNCDFWQRVQN